MNGSQVICKRTLDLIAASLALIVLSPLFALIAVAIVLDSSGPVIFRQRRSGLNGRPFTLLKFRTMFQGAPDIRNADGSSFNSAIDVRVTRVGRFLRLTSLDELPQLLNVLNGDMSLVGPRPDLVDQTKYYQPHEQRRLTVKPGITGLAQINGRNAISWSMRTRFDLDYVSRQSFWLDLMILWETTGYVLLCRDIFIGEARRTAR